ncbi:MAG TPA: TerC family protein [Stellaceae bacterium]|nr:TerC family protein [Stellaceae bacterium]
MIAWLGDPNTWASLLTLTALEIVLGIDNLIFIAVLASRLPPDRQASGRRVGLLMALLTRLALLGSIAWMVGLTRPLFTALGQSFSWRDLILVAGGMFLLFKGTREIHDRVEAAAGPDDHPSAAASFVGTIGQIMLFDIVFSLDSVITAVGMATQFSIMAIAVILAVLIMAAASTPISNFIQRHPTVKMLAFSFLLLIGLVLVVDGVGFHVPRGYIYAAMGFSALVEGLNILAGRPRREPQDSVRREERASTPLGADDRRPPPF